MEADWEFEVGGDGPVIEALWPGFVDLRIQPELARDFPEAVDVSALAPTLVRLNSSASPVWTSKCGAWAVNDSHGVDADELDAPLGGAGHTCGCYVDLLPKSDEQWATPDLIAAGCSLLCVDFRAVALRSCRVDLVIRRAYFLPERMGLGITSYLTACGNTPGQARTVLQAALGPFADVLCGDRPKSLSTAR